MDCHVCIDVHFNPLHREGGDLVQLFNFFNRLEFQSTPPRGWRLYGQNIPVRSNRFQSTPPRGWRHDKPTHFLPYPNFNPLHREGGDPSSSRLPDASTTFQSTPPRGWRLRYMARMHCGSGFQSTPPRGWRLRYMARMHCGSGFQSTPPRGWRQGFSDVLRGLAQISIHSTARVETDFTPNNPDLPEFQSTPPRGWRLICFSFFLASSSAFQSTPPRGWRLHLILIFFLFWIFQSTPPRGWRPFSEHFVAEGKSDFNPLHREGGDPSPNTSWLKVNPISIHSTARVETPWNRVLAGAV